MTSETNQLITHLSHAEQEKIGQLTFWRGMLFGYPVVISKTKIGAANAAAATTLAIEHYHPIAIINQGTAGGLSKNDRVGDVVGCDLNFM